MRQWLSTFRLAAVAIGTELTTSLGNPASLMIVIGSPWVGIRKMQEMTRATSSSGPLLPLNMNLCRISRDRPSSRARSARKSDRG